LPITSSDLQADLLKKALLGCAAVATVVTAFSLLIDPTSGMNDRLDAIEPVFGKALVADAGRVVKIDAARMAQAPIFVMTSGAGAYKEKTFQLFGVSVSSKRKAALVSIDGAAAAWMIAGMQNGDVRLLDVGGNGAVFETPVGTRNVALTDAPAAAEPKAPAQ
jgi:hypothetical protein